jgi:hypothetical protein
MTTILECGHPSTSQKPGAGGTGYAVFHDGSKCCYACAGALDLMLAHAGTLTFGYLQTDGREYPGSYATVTDWPGTVLARGLVLGRRRAYTPSGGSYDIVTGRVQVGSRTYAFRGPGNGMYVRLRLVKGPVAL